MKDDEYELNEKLKNKERKEILETRIAFKADMLKKKIELEPTEEEGNPDAPKSDVAVPEA
jgi:hypothetical protein